MKYQQAYDGDWISPIKKGYRILCCDCSLVHVIDFKTVKRGRGISVMLRVRRDARATRRARARKRK